MTIFVTVSTERDALTSAERTSVYRYFERTLKNKSFGVSINTGASEKSVFVSGHRNANALGSRAYAELADILYKPLAR